MMDTLAIVKALLCEGNQTQPCNGGTFFRTGTAYFLRTVTYHIVGRMLRREGNLLILTDAAWVADSGRWAEATAKGTLNEVEPFPPGHEVAVNLDTITDATAWNHQLPLGVK